LNHVLEGLAVTIRETAAEITWDPLPTVRADATQLGQLLQNLLGNALKYRGERPPRIHVAVERQGQRWQFAVRDNGIGIDPEYAERIFLVFQRLHTRDEYPGTGIGLAICQKIVERHGGQLLVDSQVGQGATFSFTLPAVEEDEV
jgi:light-regulated signal transduction histidine kinase (bacteriophytochrome)